MKKQMIEEVKKTRPVKRKKEATPIMTGARRVRVAGLEYRLAYLVMLLAPRRVYEQMHTSNGTYHTNKMRSSSQSSFSTDSNTLHDINESDRIHELMCADLYVHVLCGS